MHNFLGMHLINHCIAMHFYRKYVYICKNGRFLLSGSRNSMSVSLTWYRLIPFCTSKIKLFHTVLECQCKRMSLQFFETIAQNTYICVCIMVLQNSNTLCTILNTTCWLQNNNNSHCSFTLCLVCMDVP